jgi:radical SAM superfamily enzyme YgiQ (UPF0313 family)
MRVLLINPADPKVQGYHTIGSKIPHLGLQVLAQQTPPQHTVDIHDEIFGQVTTESTIRSGGYDLVGLTAYTCSVTRAYQLSRVCREVGVRCILGGPHAWACPDEAAAYFDSVAVGECDAIWPNILEDAAAGKLQPRYTGSLAPMDNGFGRAAQHARPLNGRYSVAAIQTSRGCPVGCDYCSVTLFNGGTIRRRSIDAIIEEWNDAPLPFFFVVDDNFFGVGPAHAAWAKDLLRAIIKRGKKRLWFSQTSINMGDDIEGLRLAYKAGCRGMLVGIESFNADNLKAFHKGLNNKNLDRYRELVANFHKAGISVFGAFIIGGDFDTPETVVDTAAEAVRIGVDTIQITNLTPLPGTKMFDRMMADGRVTATNFPEDWRRYTFIETVFKPARMTADQLDEAMYKLRCAAAAEKWVWKRTLRTLVSTRSLTSAIFIHGINKGWKRMAKKQVAEDCGRFGKVYALHELDARLRQAFTMMGT